MIEHFDNHLNIRKLILEWRPKRVVECGAGDGETTRALAYMQLFFPFEFHAISDKELDIDDVEWHTGLSYEVLKEFEDNSIDLCFIDTDHNYWTLQQELIAIRNKISLGGHIILHDVEAFYHNTGAALSYWNDKPYPKDEIMASAKFGGLGDCLIDFLKESKGIYRLERFIPESNGMAVIRREHVTQTQVITPGTNPLYAKPVPAATNG